MGEAEPKYNLVIELYDHTSAHLGDASPTWPRTPTRLPVALDQQLRSTQHRLILPAPGRDFWSPLPSTSLLSPTPSGAIELATSPRVWSQSTGLRSPPAIATSQLWTPSQGQPGVQQSQLDYRFGPLAVDWVDSPSVPRAAPPMSPSLSTGMGELSLHTTASGSVSPRPGATRAAQSSSAEVSAACARPAETAGTTELHWGVIHLFREAGVSDAERSDLKAKKRAMDQDDGTVVGIVSVPGVLTAAAILTFISPALESIAQLRMLR